MRWVAETASLTYSTADSLTGDIPLQKVTGETPDISEYLDFGLYDPIWFKDNADTSPSEPDRWLGVFHRTGRLMTYYVLNQNGQVLSRSTIQRVTNLKLSTTAVQETFKSFDDRIHSKFKTGPFAYHGDKPNPEDWTEHMDNDEDFCHEFQQIYNNPNIKEADDNTHDALDDTYLNVEIALSRDSEGPEFVKVVKRLRDSNGLPIGTANDNLILDTPKLMMRAIDSSYLTQLLTTELIALKSNLMMFLS